nr:MAG TPA: hypothetical protein [Caudoviricetes sp.]
MAKIDTIVCNVIDMAIDDKLMLDGNEPSPNKKEALKKRINYLKYLLDGSKDELEEIEGIEEIEKYL